MSELEVERVGGYIRLTGKLDRGVAQRAETIPGSAFIAAGPAWKFPLTMSTCRKLRETFGERLHIAPKLRQWARDQNAIEADLGQLATMTDAELFHVSDRINKAMAQRTYQRVAAAFIADAGSCILADQPGLGKTIEILAGLQEANPSAETRYHLVFAPSVAVSGVWPGEVRHWCGAENAVAHPIRGDRGQRTEKLAAALSVHAGGLDVYVVCNLEMARIKPQANAKGKPEFKVANAVYPELFAREWDTIVVDEHHRALIKKGKPTQLREGLTKLAAKRRIATSGTPMRGDPMNLWGVLNWLRPDLYPSKWRWIAQYWEIYKTRWSAFNVAGFLPGGEDQLAADLRAIMLRRTKQEVLPELPPKMYAGQYLIPNDDESPLGVWLEMTDTQKHRYEKFVNEGTVRVGGKWLIANGTLAERTRRLQIAASEGTMLGEDWRHQLPSPKFDWLVDFLDELGHFDQPEPERVIVSSYSTDLLEVFARGLAKLDIDVHLLTGKSKDRDRVSMAADFQSKHPAKRVFLLNASAGGVALTLDMADYLVMLDESTIPDDDEQVEDRAHRTSRLHQLTIYKLRMLGTVEEEVAWIAAARESVQKYILDGARGVDYARSVYLDKSQDQSD